MLEHEYDEFAKTYDGNYDTPEYRHEDEDLIRLISQKAVGRVLDVGCGTGMLLDYLSIAPENYIGIDPSDGMLEKARAKHPDYDFRKAILEDLDPTEIGQFDFVVALYGVASYIKPEKYYLIDYLTKQGGTYFVMAYKKGYFPKFYSDAMKFRVNGNQDHKRLGEIGGAKQFVFTNYLITTNAELEDGVA